MPELAKTILANSSNLKAYYRFESGALTTDSSGQGKTLTNNNTATETTGKFGGGVAFNGSNQSLTIAEDFALTATNWTISVWAKPSSSSQLKGVVALGNGGSNGVSIYQGNGSGSAGNKIDGHLHGVVWLASGVDWTGTDYDHVVLTRDATTTRIYVNGVYKNSTTSAPAAPNDVFEIGKMGTSYWAGSVDEVAVFDTALTADQIKELYEGHIYGELRPNQFGTTVGLWHLNGNSTDFSGNNNHGTDTAITYSAANGKWGQGAGFDGTTSQITTSLALNSYTNLSVCQWLKATDQSDGRVCFANDAPGFDNSLQMGVRPEVNAGYGTTKKFSIIYQRNSDSSRHSVEDPTDITAGVWIFWAFTYDGSNMRLYKNGNVVATTALASAVFTSTAVTIGANLNSGRRWNGEMDEVSIHSTALTANQIRQLYAYQKGLLGRYA